MRSSTITTQKDSAGEYETEVFGCENPARIIIGVHGNGVRRWDGEKFYYAVAEHYPDSVVVLADQNQQAGDGILINPLPVLCSRVEKSKKAAAKQYPGVPIIVIAHSMGCGVTARIGLGDVAAVFFIAAAVGTPAQYLIERYGNDIVKGKTVKTSDGLTKIISKEYYDSVKGINWENEYAQLVQRYSPVYAYEAGDDEIVGEGRFVHRTIPFTSYEIIEGAKHNFSSQALTELFQKMDTVLKHGSR